MLKNSLTIGLMLYVVTAFSQYAATADEATKPEPKRSNENVTENATELASLTATKPTSDNVKVIIKDRQIIEEYRQKGELVMVKVIPEDGIPYYLDPQVRHKRTGAYSDLINSGVEPVQWVIKRF